MNIQNNKRFQDTEQNICDTFLALLEKTELNKISVNALCQETHINRSTFYAHFEDITALIHHIDAKMRTELMASFPSNDYMKAYADGSFLPCFLTFVKKHVAFYRASLMNRTTFPIKDGFDALMNTVVKPLCEKALITNETQILYTFIFYQAGFTMVLKHWVINGCKEEIEEVALYLKHCLHLPH